VAGQNFKLEMNVVKLSLQDQFVLNFITFLSMTPAEKRTHNYYALYGIVGFNDPLDTL